MAGYSIVGVRHGQAAINAMPIMVWRTPSISSLGNPNLQFFECSVMPDTLESDLEFACFHIQQLLRTKRTTVRSSAT
jgi:hypothetical protein